MNWEEQLGEIFNDPIFADVKPAAVQVTSNDRLLAAFEEVNRFYDEHNRLPSSDGGIKEKGLARRFESIVCDLDKQKHCLPYDRHGLIQIKEADVNSELESIFNDPIFNIDTQSQSLFVVPEHLKKEVVEKSEADFVAQRRKCEDFDKYKQRFIDVHKELKDGSRRVVKFSEAQLQEGAMFLVGGVLVLLNKIFEKKVDKNYKTDGRTHCIFENGTESNMLLRSLGKAIYLDGYAITESCERDESYLKEQFNIESEDIATGYIYVLRSKSDNPAISQYKDLYKIGFTTTSVEERVANASAETTYLLADVDIIATWKTYNLNTSYFETMLHRLFDQVQLQVKIHHTSGAVIVPHEWFIVPLPIIRNAIDYIIKGVAVSYNAEQQLLEEHKLKKLSDNVDLAKLKKLPFAVTEVFIKEVLSGTRKTIERKIKQSNISKFTYQDKGDSKRWLIEYDAIKLTANNGAKRSVVVVAVSEIKFDRDNNSVIYTLGGIIAVE
ncbi:MAG: GIY-YIG nuclease family protein [Rikenellaceae bacterium]